MSTEATPLPNRIAREVVLTVLTLGALGEILWTIYLGWHLPRHYVANHWDLAWVGLDSAQILMLLLAAWAAWRQRALLILFSSVAGALLLTDAWFDVTTARYTDLRYSVLALVIELPSAIALFWIAFFVFRRVTEPLRTLADGTVVSRRHIAIPGRPTPPGAKGS